MDLIDGSDAELDRVLAGAEVVVDVTNSPTIEQDGATTFFETVAERLGAAATRAGVGRTVLLSIIGVNRTPGGRLLRGQAGPRARHGQHAPGVRVLRAAQFHEFAEQSLGWGRHGEVATIPDMPVQPVALAEVVRMLLELARGRARAGAAVELAGPRRERLADLVTRLVAARGERVRVEPAAVSAAVRDGALLPGPDADAWPVPDFASWLAERP